MGIPPSWNLRPLQLINKLPKGGKALTERIVVGQKSRKLSEEGPQLSPEDEGREAWASL